MRTRHLALAAVFASALMAGPALADDLMANTYANTVTTKNKANGAGGTLLFNQDGTYSGTTAGPDGKPVSYTGKWSTKDDGKTLCLTVDAPPGGGPAPKPSCSPLSAHNVGDSWNVTNDLGDSYDVSLSAGR
ncbi:MAG: hypothetical protein GC166_03455 [Alphaproteobacteria bacterium]|nr:hypothetical protein [Alphaproteobacteria bacterium]